MRQYEMDTLRPGALVRPQLRHWMDLHKYLCCALPDQPPVCLVISIDASTGVVCLTGLSESGLRKTDAAMFYDIIEDSFDYQDCRAEAIAKASRLEYTTMELAAQWYRIRGQYDTAAWLEEQYHQSSAGNGFLRMHGSPVESLNSP